MIMAMHLSAPGQETNVQGTLRRAVKAEAE
jgi:hypothetical protein